MPNHRHPIVESIEAAIVADWHKALLRDAMTFADDIEASALCPNFDRAMIHPMLRMTRVIMSVRHCKMLWSQHNQEYLIELTKGDLHKLSHHFVTAVEHYGAASWLDAYDAVDYADFKTDERVDGYFVELFKV